MVSDDPVGWIRIRGCGWAVLQLGSADGHPTNPRVAADDWRILPDDCTVGQTKYKYSLLLTTT